MAATSNDVHVSSTSPAVLSPSALKCIHAQSQRRSCTQRVAVTSDCPGHIGALGRECSGEQGGRTCGGSENYNKRLADVDRGRNRKTSYRRDKINVLGRGHLDTDEGGESFENILDSEPDERNMSHHGVKRFKRGAQQHVCNNEKMHPRNRHRGVFLDYSEFAEKYPYLKSYLRNARFGQCNINFRDPLALYSLSKAILKEFYGLEFQLPVDENHRYLIPCVPSRANYLHHIADQLADVDLEATAYLKGDIPGNDTSCEDRNSGDTLYTHGGDNRSRTTTNTVPCSAVSSSTKWSSKRRSSRDFRSHGSGETSSCETSNGSPPSSAPVNTCSGSSSINTSSESAVSSRLTSDSSRNTDDSVHPLHGERVAVLDIGVGANCIYPLLGSREYGWRFVGSDVSEASLAVAERNVRMNALEGNISLRLQPRRENVFVNVVKPGEFYSLTMCNPPFHNSREQVNVCPVRVLDAQDHEIMCEGGEWQFILNMIEESKIVCAQVLWFTTLVARAATVKQVKKHIWEELRCFSHGRQEQEKLMESSWRKHAAAVKVAQAQCSEETPAANSMISASKEAADAGRNHATPPARKEATVGKHEEKQTEEPTHRAEESFEEKMRPHLPEEVSIEEAKEYKHGRAVEEGPTSFPCSPEEQKGTTCEELRPKFPVHICEFRVKELLQGKQTRWVICWTYWTAEQRKVVRTSIRDALL